MSDVHAGLEALAELRVALARYGVSATYVVREVEVGSSGVVDRITAEIGTRTATLAAAQDALTACSRQRDADCTREGRRVAHAQQELDRAKRAVIAAETAVAAHAAPRRGFSTRIEQLVGEGSGTLAQQVDRLHSYLHQAGGDVTGSARWSGGTGSNAFGSGGPTSIPGAPKGFALVPLSMIDTSESPVTGAGDFTKGYTSEDLAWAHHALHEQILPAMKIGKGAEYFQTRDAHVARHGTRSLSDTYSGFFGDSAIKLEIGSTPDSYRIANGYHRVWVAQRTGLTHVVARLP